MKYVYNSRDKDQSNLIKGEIYYGLMSPHDVIFMYVEDLLTGENPHTDCYGVFADSRCANGLDLMVAPLEKREFLLQKMRENGYPIHLITDYSIY